jgi:hypothetical protein
MARSVDEVALIRNTISHYAPMLIALLSIPRVPLRGMNFSRAKACRIVPKSTGAIPMILKSYEGSKRS